MIYHLDYETTSKCDIKLGAYRYACDPSTRILLAAVSKGDAEPAVWRFDEADSVESRQAESWLAEAIESGSLIYAHNSQFELAVSQTRLLPDMGIDSQPDINTWRCTQAMCRRAAIPESLGKAAAFLKLPDQKEAVGKSLIKIFSNLEELVTLEPPVGMIDPESQKVMKNGNLTKGKKPKNRKSNSPILDSPVLWDWQVKVKGDKMSVRAAWDMFILYCRQDVKVEQLVHQKLARFELIGAELASFQLDMRTNHRGVPMNLAALDNAQVLIEGYQDKVEKRMMKMCGLRSSQGVKLLVWLKERGFKEDNLQSETVEKAINKPGDLTPLALEVLKCRALLSFAAIAKVKTFRAAAGTDGRVRGTSLWHGARTGRDTGRITQFQNVKKSTISDSDVAYDMICQGIDLPTLEAMWESPLETIASCTRHFVQLPDGKLMLDADFIGVEARITPWLVGDYDKLQSITDGVDQYKSIATKLFKVPYDEVTKYQRTIAKPVELGCCIAEGQLVLTDRGLVPIQNVTLDDLVWDGVEWVSNEGLLFQGYREVVTYQGLTATADHDVFVEGCERKIPFEQAIRKQLRLVDSGKGGAPIRRIQTRLSGGNKGPRLSQSSGGVLLRKANDELPRCSEERIFTPLYEMPGSQPEVALSEVAFREVPCSQSKMRESRSSSIQRLWRKGREVLLCFTFGSRSVDDGQPRVEPPSGDRSDRQLGELRGRKSQVVLKNRADAKQPENSNSKGGRLQPRGVAFLERHNRETTSRRLDERTDFDSRERIGNEEDKKLDSHPTKVRVYDLLNAGPRHRFTVSGKLVSNCFGVGGKGLMDSLAKPPYNIRRTRAECNGYVAAYREAHAATVNAWKEIEEAAKGAIRTGRVHKACDDKLAFGKIQTAGIDYLVMRLPSGRRMYYPHPTIKATFKKYDEEDMLESHWKREKGGYWIDSISFYGKVEKVWCRIHTWGSRLFENAVQATGADLLNYGCLRLEQEGFKIIMRVHDQVIAENDGQPVEKFRETFCKREPWATSFPLAADASIVPYYLKDS